MHFVNDNRGAEMSEIIAGLAAVLAAGMIAINLVMGGLQTAATNIKTWVSAITIAAPQTP
jgi:hypothetical protein